MNRPQERYSGLTRRKIADITTQQMTPPNETNDEAEVEVDRNMVKDLKKVVDELGGRDDSVKMTRK